MNPIRRWLQVLTFRFPRRVPGRLHAFALAEHGSMINLRLAAVECPDAARAAAYLAHAADEERHARMFARHARRLAESIGAPPPPPVRADSEQLYRRLGEVGFLAFVHRGERRGRREFEVYRDFFAARGDERTAALFAAIVEDEARHERYTGELLAELAPSARPALRRAALWEAWRRYRRAGRDLAAVVYVLGMAAIYLACAPFALLVRLLRPARPGWRRLEG